MGQAKQRGTFEQRQADAIERNVRAEQKELDDRMNKWSRMSRDAQRKHLMAASLMVALESAKESK